MPGAEISVAPPAISPKPSQDRGQASVGSEGARDVIGKNGDSSGGETRPGRFVDSESLQLPLLAGCLAAAAAVAGEELPASCSGSRRRGETDRDAELVSCGRFQAHRPGSGRATPQQVWRWR